MHLMERLGGKKTKPVERGPVIWIHAVSVGEVLSLRGLISRIRNEFPDWVVHVSTLTESGYRTARETLTAADRIFFLPFDFAAVLKRKFSQLRPDILVLTESEFWPNLIRLAGKRTRAVLVINGRLSRRSFNKYRRMKLLIRRVLRPISRFLVQTETDRRRLLDLGFSDSRITVAGNLKAEISMPRREVGEPGGLRKNLGVPNDAWIWTAGSTHRGEEEIILAGFQPALAGNPRLRLILAPRHPHRADEVEKIARSLDLKVRRRSREGRLGGWEVLLLDTIGELASMYALSRGAFIGGSLIRHGGQNLLEPAYYSRPVFFGPHMDNFSDLSEIFIERGAARVVKNAEDIRDMFQSTGGPELDEMGRTAREILTSLQGALDKTVSVLEEILSPRPEASTNQ